MRLSKKKLSPYTLSSTIFNMVDLQCGPVSYINENTHHSLNLFYFYSHPLNPPTNGCVMINRCSSVKPCLCFHSKVYLGLYVLEWSIHRVLPAYIKMTDNDENILSFFFVFLSFFDSPSFQCMYNSFSEPRDDEITRLYYFCWCTTGCTVPVYTFSRYT